MAEIVLQKVMYNENNPGIVNETVDEELITESNQSQDFTVAISQCKIIRDDFGSTEDEKTIHRFTLLNKEVSVQIMTYGATITSVTMPDKQGVIDDIIMGYDTADGYKNSRNPYFGATIGRITGIIPEANISIEDEQYYLSNNFINTHANGGFVGFDKVLWNSYIENDKLYLTYMSRDAEEGFPGDVIVTRSYELTNENELIIETTAKCTKPTPIDITTHIDWNLASHMGGPDELYNHYLMINADKYAQVDKDQVPTGKLKKVGQTVLDFRIPRPIGRLIHKIPGGGYNHFLSLTRGSRKGVTFAAKLIHPHSGRYLEILCDQPGLLIYTQNNLYAHKNITEGHPVSCWTGDLCYLLQHKSEIEGEGEYELKNEEELEAEFEIKETEDVEEEFAEGDNLAKKLEPYTPIVGKVNAEYIRHGAIRLVPANYPEPVAKRRKYCNYLLNPGETYLNTTIYKFGTVYEKPHNLAELVV